jgi:hypothetical protein
MKRFIIVMLLISGTINISKACTACGCSANNEYLGLLPQTSNDFIGFQYLVRGFNTDLPDDGGGDPFGLSHDTYTTFQLWGRYNINNRIQVLAFIPYIYNTRTLNGIKTVNSGLSDVTVMGNYRLVDKSNGAWKQTLLIGAGLKMPTGKYDSHAIQLDEGLPNMQPGTNSWDMIGDINYTLGYKQFGVNVDFCYAKTTPNSDSYKFGNRQTVGVLGYYRIHKNDFILLPQFGFKYDHANQDYTDFSTETKDDMSGGWQLHTALGMQAFYKHIGLQLIYDKPIDQHYASGLVTMKYKVETGILFMF